MEFGKIQREMSPITLPEWKKVIAPNAFLEQMSPRTGINPFTKEKVVFSGEGCAYYVVDGVKMGNASLENGEILTTGMPREVCEEIARSLKATVFEDDRS